MTDKQKNGTGTDRRNFLKASAVAIAAPLYVPHTAFGANDRIVTGHIGVGRQGRGNLGRFMSYAGAICDVDADHRAQALKMAAGKGRKCKEYSDYRDLLDSSDIDAVVVSTPDHWHALPTIHACEAGKDVYCEKPLSLTIQEGRQMVDAARKHKRIVQTGSQQRSSANFRLACELVRSGRIGKITEVRVAIPTPNHPGDPGASTKPPSNLDFDMWLGPAPKVEYNKNKVHYNFRFWRDYSGGQMTNWGAHHLDIAQWGLGFDETGPKTVVGRGEYHPKKWHEVTEKAAIRYIYEDGREIQLAQGYGDWGKGATFVGTEGRIFVTRGKLISDPADVVKEPLGKDDVKLYDSSNHVSNFIDCIKSRELPICDVAIGHRTATLCHLGNLSIELGRELTWDAENEKFIDDDKANEELSRPKREPYTV